MADGSLYDILITLANEAFYASGDGLTLSLTAFAGIVTSSASKARITIPVAKSLANISTISVDVCKGGIRVPAGGYLDGVGDTTDWVGRSGITVSAEKEGDYYITLAIDKTSAFSNVSNNMPVVMYASEVTLSFN